MPDYVWDLFICHAWEDKRFVGPLAENLTALGLRVWYDDYRLQLGDSLSRSIDAGLAESRFGLVVISQNFFKKEYPQHEYRGLVAKQTSEGRKVVLPIWHGVSKEDVLRFSPTLVDQLGIRTTDMAAEEIGLKILATVRPDIYEQYERSDLLKLYKGKPLHELHDELVRLRENLSEFQCPHCGALMAEHSMFGDDTFEVDRKIFECGLHYENLEIERACPYDPDLPDFSEFELEYSQPEKGSWHARGNPKTARAKRFGRLDMYYSYGEASKELAAEQVHASYLQKVRPVEWKGVDRSKYYRDGGIEPLDLDALGIKPVAVEPD